MKSTSTKLLCRTCGRHYFPSKTSHYFGDEKDNLNIFICPKGHYIMICRRNRCTENLTEQSIKDCDGNECNDRFTCQLNSPR